MPKALIRELFASPIVSSEPTGWNMPVSRNGFACLDAEGDDVLDFELDCVADAHDVPRSLVANLEGPSAVRWD
jgi:hypothetical protein